VAGFCEHGDEPLVSIKKVGHCLTSSVTIGISKNILLRGVCKCVSLYWIHMSQDRDRWRDLLNMVMNRWGP
jgi:hypothetical protein